MTVRCRHCGTPVHTAESRKRRVGSECWDRLTPQEKDDALRLAEAEAQPGYIPPPRPPSPTALRNKQRIRQTIATAAAPANARCHHGGTPGKCKQCDRENDPDRAAARIIALVRADREQPRRPRPSPEPATPAPPRRPSTPPGQLAALQERLKRIERRHTPQNEHAGAACQTG